MSLRPCPVCGGARLRAESRAVLVGGTRIEDFCALSARRALEWLAEVELSETDRHVARLILREISERLQFLENVGIGYLSMSRAAATLSGGEAQRIRLATQIGSSLVGVLYILDEPSIGLHQRDNAKLIGTLQRLRDLGNTRDRGRARRADDARGRPPRRPRARRRRARRAGSSPREPPSEVAAVPGVADRPVPLGRARDPVPERRRTPSGYVEIVGASEHNLRDIDVHIPLGVLTCVTGVSGSGKSTLVNDVLFKAVANRLHRARKRPGAHRAIHGLEQLDKVIAVDQSPIGRTPRSNPATYTGLFDDIRDLFSKTQEARARGYKPGRFSFNVKGGRCEVCRGDGQIKIEMHFLPDVYVPCEQCNGKRYNRETLEVRFKGRSIADVLDMPVEEALEFFEHIPKIRRRAGDARRGRASATSGSASRRRRSPAARRSASSWRRELSKIATGRTLYILDEPTTGLHFADVQRLLEVLQRLVDAGNTVVVIEHNLDVIKCADRMIDLGPEGGEEGGMAIAVGTPEEVAAEPASYTGQVPRRRCSADRAARGKRAPSPVRASAAPGCPPEAMADAGSPGRGCGRRKWRWYERNSLPWNRARIHWELMRREAFARWPLHGNVLEALREGRLEIGGGGAARAGRLDHRARRARVSIGDGHVPESRRDGRRPASWWRSARTACSPTAASSPMPITASTIPPGRSPGRGSRARARPGSAPTAGCGANVVVTSGVTIGERCVIGANSVVTRDVEPFSIAAGAPARVLRHVEYRARRHRIERDSIGLSEAPSD